MIKYEIYSQELENTQIADGFFENWPKYPNKADHRRILSNSYKSIVAIDGGKIIGFINIISDGVLSAYIPLLEVIPIYRGKGIGRRLVEMAIEETKNLYMIDLCCDRDLSPFYKRFGMFEATAMIARNYGAQSGI